MFLFHNKFCAQPFEQSRILLIGRMYIQPFTYQIIQPNAKFKSSPFETNNLTQPTSTPLQMTQATGTHQLPLPSQAVTTAGTGKASW